MPPEAINHLRNSLGLNDPWYIRLFNYFAALLRGDMGLSIFQNQPDREIIVGRLGATIELAVVALILASAIGIGIALGVLATVRQGSCIDTVTMLFASSASPMPVYWIGLLLMLLFAVQLGWLPSIGRGAPLSEALLAALTGRPHVLWQSIGHIALPASTLAANSAVIISRLVRASMLEVLREDFVRTAYAKGLRAGRVVVRHALLSVIGLRFGALLGGAVLTETIFAWPGLGRLTISAISQRDLPLIQGIVLTFAIVFALVKSDHRPPLWRGRLAHPSRVTPCAYPNPWPMLPWQSGR